MRQSEFRRKVKEASEAELEQMLNQERENLYKMRQMIALKQLDNPHAIQSAKKNISRILCELHSRRIAAGRRA